jgi:hypothetical protein
MTLDAAMPDESGLIAELTTDQGVPRNPLTGPDGIAVTIRVGRRGMPVAGGACLRRQGVSPRGDELNYGDCVRQSPVSADFGQCLTAAARETFPGMPSRITVFY